MFMFIKLVLAIVLLVSAVEIPCLERLPTEKDEVLAVIDTLTDGWREGDSKKVASALHPNCRFVTLRSPTETQVGTREHLLESVKGLKPGDWDDRVRDPEVRIDSTGIATVWAKYEFFINGKRSHCGIESFQLYRLPEGWKIVNFADTHSASFCK